MEFNPGLIQLLKDAQTIAALTGAGISKESGIPTFREVQTGLWARYDPQELATAQAFKRDPELVWEWYQWRRGLVSEAAPNPGHFALVNLAKQVGSFTLITQNVDGLHQAAGSQDVIELHGNITRTKCFDQHHPVENYGEIEGLPPRCPQCKSLLRPDVVWFGESLPAQALEDAFRAAEQAEVFISIGTSAVVEPAASLPRIAFQAGAVVVEVNPDETPLSPIAHHNLRGLSGTILPDLLQQAWP